MRFYVEENVSVNVEGVMFIREEEGFEGESVLGYSREVYG